MRQNFSVGVIPLRSARAPKPASAAAFENMPMVVSIGLGLVIVLAAAVLLWRSQSAFAAQIASAPIGLIRISRQKATATALARELLACEATLRREEVSQTFVEADAKLVQDAVSKLRASGVPFEGSFQTKAGRSVSLVGKRAGGAELLWISDAGEPAQLAKDLAIHSGESALLRHVLDKLPMPIWWRSEALEIIGCNSSYTQALDSETSTENNRELGAGYLDRDGRGLAKRAAKSGGVQSESHHIVIDGTRRLLEFTEAPAKAQFAATVGYATDVTMIEAVQSELAALVAAHAEVLEMLGAAIAIYGPDRRLKFFNSAFLDLWRVETSALSGEPTMGEVLDMLRDRRRLPEYIDFPAFKQETDSLFHSLIDPREELLHLPDERTLRMMVSPHPMGGLLFVYEDVTDRLALERSYNTSIAVQRETLNKLHEAVTVFGGDGRLKLWNPAAVEMWRLTETEAILDAHIGDLIEHTRRYFPPSEDWDQRKQRLILSVTEPEQRFGRLERTDGLVIDFSCVPLPDGGCLLGYIDVTDSVRVQRALEERNLALQHADRLKSDFIANVSYELRTPPQCHNRVYRNSRQAVFRDAERATGPICRWCSKSIESPDDADQRHIGLGDDRSRLSGTGIGANQCA
jgi:PAS domain-containing protein